MDHEDAEAALLVLSTSSVVILSSLFQDLHQLCRLLSKGSPFILVPTMEAVDPWSFLSPVHTLLLFSVLY